MRIKGECIHIAVVYLHRDCVARCTSGARCARGGPSGRRLPRTITLPTYDGHIGRSDIVPARPARTRAMRPTVSPRRFSGHAPRAPQPSESVKVTTVSRARESIARAAPREDGKWAGQAPPSGSQPRRRGEERRGEPAHPGRSAPERRTSPLPPAPQRLPQPLPLIMRLCPLVSTASGAPQSVTRPQNQAPSSRGQ